MSFLNIAIWIAKSAGEDVMDKKKATVMMCTEEGVFPYGTYPYGTVEEKERVVSISLEVQRERAVYTYIQED